MLVAMHRFLVIWIAAVAIAGCRDHELEQVKTVRDEVCKCKSVECGETAMKKLPQRDVKPGAKAQTYANEMLTCMAKLYLRDRPSTDPDAPVPDPTARGSSDPASARKP
jgi:hypothetical protein